jgi:Insertion element 4 transposase N-terminal
MVRTAARLPNGTRISDHVALGVLTTTIPADLVDAVLAETGRQSQRQRQLPARLVVYYVLGLALVTAQPTPAWGNLEVILQP